MGLGERIQFACSAAGISQAELARRVPCKPQQITDLIRNKRLYSKHFPRIASVLGVEVAWLTTGKGPSTASRGSVRLDQPPYQPIPADIGIAILDEIRQLRADLRIERSSATDSSLAEADNNLQHLSEL